MSSILSLLVRCCFKQTAKSYGGGRYDIILAVRCFRPLYIALIMKIYTAIVSLIAIVVIVLSACGDDDGPRPGEPTTVVLWEFGGVPGLREWVQQAVDNFNAERSGIHI